MRSADLVRDVVPGAGGAQVLEPLAEHVAHLDDAIGHLLQLGHPLRLQLRVAQDLSDEGSTLLGWRRIHGAHHELDLR